MIKCTHHVFRRFPVRPAPCAPLMLNESIFLVCFKSTDPNLDNDEHQKAASIRKHNKDSEAVQRKPLAGRIFYLDLPCNKRSQVLETDLKSLGGVSTI